MTTPGGVAALYAGAFGDFDVAYISDNGGEGGLAIVSGSFSDELVNSETFPTRIEYDHRGPIDLKNSSLADPVPARSPGAPVRRGGRGGHQGRGLLLR